MTVPDVMPAAAICRGLAAFRLFRAFGVEPEEDEPASGVGTGSDSDREDFLNGGLEVAVDGDGQGK